VVFVAGKQSREGLQRFFKRFQNQDRDGRLRRACGENSKKKSSEPFLTVNKGSSLGASLLDEAGSPLPKQEIVHYVSNALYL